MRSTWEQPTLLSSTAPFLNLPHRQLLFLSAQGHPETSSDATFLLWLLLTQARPSPRGHWPSRPLNPHTPWSTFRASKTNTRLPHESNLEGGLTYLGGPGISIAPVHINAMLPQKGQLPRAVHEAWAQKPTLTQAQRLLNTCTEGPGVGGVLRARMARGAHPANNWEARGKLGLTSIAALLPPQQVVFGQNAPVATRLRSLEQVPRLQEGENVESQL